MNRKITVTLASGLVAAGAVVALAAPAQADSYRETSAMAQAVEMDSSATAASDASPRGVGGVAKALWAGFKAAHAPRAAGNLAHMASVLGYAAETPHGSSAAEAAYFDR